MTLQNVIHSKCHKQDVPSLRRKKDLNLVKKGALLSPFRFLVRYERVLSLAIHAACAPLSLTNINTPEEPCPNYSFSLTESP